MGLKKVAPHTMNSQKNKRRNITAGKGISQTGAIQNKKTIRVSQTHQQTGRSPEIGHGWKERWQKLERAKKTEIIGWTDSMVWQKNNNGLDSRSGGSSKMERDLTRRKKVKNCLAVSSLSVYRICDCMCMHVIFVCHRKVNTVTLFHVLLFIFTGRFPHVCVCVCVIFCILLVF